MSTAPTVPPERCASGRAVLAGMELADSLVLDPHKWLFQPYDVGCVLVRRPGALERAFSMNPEYLKDVMGDDRRGRFPQPQPRADPPLAGAQAVADLPRLRCRPAARGRGSAASSWPSTPRRCCAATRISGRSLPRPSSASSPSRCGTAMPACTPPAPRRWPIAAMPRLPRHCCRAERAAAVHDQPDDHRARSRGTIRRLAISL